MWSIYRPWNMYDYIAKLTCLWPSPSSAISPCLWQSPILPGAFLADGRKIQGRKFPVAIYRPKPTYYNVHILFVLTWEAWYVRAEGFKKDIDAIVTGHPDGCQGTAVMPLAHSPSLREEKTNCQEEEEDILLGFMQFIFKFEPLKSLLVKDIASKRSIFR